jgi:hypothetical protein
MKDMKELSVADTLTNASLIGLMRVKPPGAR